MLLTKIVYPTICSRNRDYYLDKGYEIPTYIGRYSKPTVKRGTKIPVWIEDIPQKSHIKVDISCDYCGSITSKLYSNYNRENTNAIVKNDCCNSKQCRAQKIKDSNLIKYGVDNVMNVEEYKDNLKNTLMDRYGVENISCLDEIKNKRTLKTAQTKFMRGNAPSSSQQNYIHSIIGGELNYPIKSSHLDICFPNEKIYVECDFSGHWLNVSMGNVTMKEFDTRERRRFYGLKNDGYKLIRIISPKDNIPMNGNKILESYKMALDIIESGRSWCEIYIDEGEIKCSNGVIKFDFGKVRRMRATNINDFTKQQN